MNKTSFKKLYGGSSSNSLMDDLTTQTMDVNQKLSIIDEVKKSSVIKDKIELLKKSIKDTTQEARLNLDEIERLNLEIYDTIIEIFKIKDESNEKYIEFLTELKEKKKELSTELENVESELKQTEDKIRDRSSSSLRDDEEYQSVISEFKSREEKLKNKKNEIVGKMQLIDTTSKTGEISEAELNEMLENITELIEVTNEQKEKQIELKDVLGTVMGVMKKNFEIMNKSNVNTIEQTIVELRELTPEIKMIKEKYFNKGESKEETKEEEVPSEEAPPPPPAQSEPAPPPAPAPSEELAKVDESTNIEDNESLTKSQNGGRYRKKRIKKTKKKLKKHKKTKRKKKVKGGYQYSKKSNKKSNKKSSKKISKKPKKPLKIG